MSPAFSRLAGTNVTNSTLPKQWGPWDSVSFSLMHVFVWLWCGKRKEAVGSHLTWVQKTWVKHNLSYAVWRKTECVRIFLPILNFTVSLSHAASPEKAKSSSDWPESAVTKENSFDSTWYLFGLTCEAQVQSNVWDHDFLSQFHFREWNNYVCSL